MKIKKRYAEIVQKVINECIKGPTILYMLVKLWFICTYFFPHAPFDSPFWTSV